MELNDVDGRTKLTRWNYSCIRTRLIKVDQNLGNKVAEFSVNCFYKLKDLKIAHEDLMILKCTKRKKERKKERKR